MKGVKLNVAQNFLILVFLLAIAVYNYFLNDTLIWLTKRTENLSEKRFDKVKAKNVEFIKQNITFT